MGQDSYLDLPLAYGTGFVETRDTGYVDDIAPCPRRSLFVLGGTHPVVQLHCGAKQLRAAPTTTIHDRVVARVRVLVQIVAILASPRAAFGPPLSKVRSPLASVPPRGERRRGENGGAANIPAAAVVRVGLEGGLSVVFLTLDSWPLTLASFFP